MNYDHLGNCLYSGTIADYPFHYGLRTYECGSDLQFLKNINDKRNTYLSMVDWLTPLPPEGYETYIVTHLGESENIEWIDRIKKYSGRKIIITSQVIDDVENTNDVTYFHMEHLHWYTKYYLPVIRKKLIDRTFDFACLNGRPDWHREEILSTLLANYKNLQYTWAENCPNPNYQPKYKIPVKSIPGHQWSADNYLYNDCKLHWITESLVFSHDNRLQGYLTEKIIKAIVSKCMFVMIGQRLSYKRLRNLGFETFEDYFGIDWDTEWDFERMQHTKDLINSFNFNLNLQDLVDYNYNYFHTKFFDVTDKRNSIIKEQILDYINE